MRSPFLDEDVVAYTNRLHPRWKLRRFQDKYILRQVAERWLPQAIAWRRKKMFRAPMDSFHLSETGAADVDRPGAEPGVAAEDGLLRRGGGATLPGRNPEDAVGRWRRRASRWAWWR